jgi:hypothetical protein
MRAQEFVIEAKPGVNINTARSIAGDIHDHVLDLNVHMRQYGNDQLFQRLRAETQAMMQELNDLGYEYDPGSAGYLRPLTIDSKLHEARHADARTEIENMATILPGSPDEYFVRFTDQDKVGFSARQHFGRTPDIDDPDFDPLSLPRPGGRPALWFYPLRTYLQGGDLFASQHPYTWLVRIRPDAWLQRVGRDQKTDAPQGKTRVGMIRRDQGFPIAIFFRPAFDVVDRWYQKNQTN